MKTFRQKVLNAVKEIPIGSVQTYKEVAQMAGSPLAFRAVGSILRENFDHDIPCHRVIKSSGELGDYNRGGAEEKRDILLKEKALVI